MQVGRRGTAGELGDEGGQVLHFGGSDGLGAEEDDAALGDGDGEVGDKDGAVGVVEDGGDLEVGVFTADDGCEVVVGV